MTVVRYLQAPTFPERKGRSETRKSLLSPYTAAILTRWNEGSGHSGAFLYAKDSIADQG
jgi:transposase